MKKLEKRRVKGKGQEKAGTINISFMGTVERDELKIRLFV